MEDLKKCSGPCQEEKDRSEFYKDKSRKDGLGSKCKSCEKLYKEQNKDHKKEYDKQYFQQRYQLHKEEIKEKNRQWEKQNKEKRKQQKKRYCEKNKEEIKKYIKQYRKEKYKKDLNYRLRIIISSTINWGLCRGGGSKRGSSILKKLPYTMQELKQYIESKFEPWMNWDNYGVYEENRKKWNLDHIIPQSLLLYDSMDHPNFKKCWALSNLRPLEVVENIKKSNKIKNLMEGIND
jgi:hypothetical protein